MAVTSKLGIKIIEGSDVVNKEVWNNNYATIDANAASQAELDEVNRKASDIENNLNAHIGSGGAAHPIAVANGAAGFMSGEDKGKLDAATSAITANTLVQRDSAGRFKAAAPASSDDVARKQETDAALAAAQAAQDKANSAVSKESILPNGVDLNTVTQSGFYRLQASPTNAPAGVEWGQLLVCHGGGDTIFQMVTGHSNDRFYLRHGAPPNVGGGGPWRPWALIWTSETDGAGSGLDADKLDGLDSGAFLRAAFANGYYGLALPGGNDNDWIRTTVQGLIPAYAGGASALGTSSWPFLEAHIRNIYRDGTLMPHIRDNNGVFEFFSGGAWRSVGGIKSVQRGSVIFTNYSATQGHNVTINSVNTSKAFVNIPSQFVSGSGTATTSFYAQLTSSTNLLLQHNYPHANNAVVFWEVVEFY